MKYFKYSLFLASLVLASVSFAQQEAAPAGAQEKTPASATPEKPKGAGEDRSYLADYVNEKPNMVLIDKVSKKESAVSLKSVGDKEFIFIDSSGGEVSVKKDTKAFAFRVKLDSSVMSSAKKASAASDWDGVVAALRPTAYAILPFTVFDDEAFTGNQIVEFYISSLLNANRLKEAFAYVSALSLDSASSNIVASALDVAKALVNAGKLDEAMKILDRIGVSSDAETISAIMDVLGAVRDSGNYKACVVWYTKLSNMKDNPLKGEAALWMIFCDMAMGNKMSAEVYLSNIDIKRGTPEFSLLQMIKGMLKDSAKTPDYRAALDFYSEGVVFGKLTDPWMPQLLFKTGMAYKNIKNFVASNEIFAQLLALYPENAYTKLGQKEIVEIKKEEPKSKDDSDDDDDDEDEE